LKTFLADTIALARYLEDSLPPEADKAFQEAEEGKARILVPEIVIGELVYISLKGRLKTSDPRASMRQVLDELRVSSYFQQVQMTPDSWDRFVESKARELHDRMIRSIAESYMANAIITNDRDLKSSGFPTIW